MRTFLDRNKILFIGIGAALLFIVMTGVRLDYQGVYYDELHQAPSAFKYLGKHPTLFTREFNDIPILNMSFSGAIKSHIYGIYLRYIGHSFTVYSWRLLGILFVAAGLCSFLWIAGRFLSSSAMVLFAALLLTDATVILTTRYDWGPTALGIALRLIFLATWLSLELGKRTNGKVFAAGLIIGIAIFEKLVAVVLLGPLFLIFAGARRFRTAGIAAALAGGLLGTFPLAYANYSSYRHGLGFVSVVDVASRQPLQLRRLIDFSYQYLAVGYGQLTRSHVLATAASPVWLNAEVALTLISLGIVSFLAVNYWNTNEWTTLAGKMVAAYVLVGATLFLLPKETFIHHWIQGTPFQYAAIALAFHGLSGRRLGRAALMTAVALLILVRVPNIVTIELELAQGMASPGFDPAFNRLGAFAAVKSHDAAFIEADWGTTTQMYCLTNGDDDIVNEPFLSSDSATITQRVMDRTRKNTLYVVMSGFMPEARKTVIDTVLGSPDWKEAPIESEEAKLFPIQVRKFLRVRPIA